MPAGRPRWAPLGLRMPAERAKRADVHNLCSPCAHDLCSPNAAELDGRDGVNARIESRHRQPQGPIPQIVRQGVRFPLAHPYKRLWRCRAYGARHEKASMGPEGGWHPTGATTHVHGGESTPTWRRQGDAPAQRHRRSRRGSSGRGPLPPSTSGRKRPWHDARCTYQPLAHQTRATLRCRDAAFASGVAQGVGLVQRDRHTHLARVVLRLNVRHRPAPGCSHLRVVNPWKPSSGMQLPHPVCSTLNVCLSINRSINLSPSLCFPVSVGLLKTALSLSPDPHKSNPAPGSIIKILYKPRCTCT